METKTQHPEIRADARADRRTWFFFGLFMLASFFEKSLSDRHDLLRAGSAHPDLPWLSQATSHIVILAMVPFITTMLSRFPLSADRWRPNLAIHALATVVLAAFDVAKILTPCRPMRPVRSSALALTIAAIVSTRPPFPAITVPPVRPLRPSTIVAMAISITAVAATVDPIDIASTAVARRRSGTTGTVDVAGLL